MCPARPTTAAGQLPYCRCIYVTASPILELGPYGWDALELIVKLMLTCVSKGEALP